MRHLLYFYSCFWENTIDLPIYINYKAVSQINFPSDFIYKEYENKAFNIG